MPLFRNPETGEVANYEGSAAMRVLELGYLPADSGSIQVSTPSGEETQFSTADALRASHGLNGLSAADPSSIENVRRENLHETRLEEQYGGQGVRAFAEGALSGGSLGLYDVAADKLGMDTENVRKANQGAGLAGEIGGLLSASILSGGAGLVGAAARLTPAGAATALGVRTTAAINGGVGVGALAAGQMVEGAAYAAGQTFSKVLVRDEPLAASAVFSEVGRNALFGAGGGLAGAVLVKGLAKFGDAALGQGMAAPLVDMSTKEGRAVAKSMRGAVDELHNITNDVEAALAVAGKASAKPAVDPLADILTPGKHKPAAGFAKVKPGAVDESVAPIVPGPRGLKPEDVAAPAPDAPPLEVAFGTLRQRKKHLTAVGDQVLDDVVMRGDKALAADIRGLRRAHSEMEKAYALADEAKSAAAMAGASRTAAAYEKKVAELAGKAGFDVGKQLDAAVAQIDDVFQPRYPGPVRARDRRNASLLESNKGVVEDVAGYPRAEIPNASAATEAMDNVAAREAASLDDFAAAQAGRNLDTRRVDRYNKARELSPELAAARPMQARFVDNAMAEVQATRKAVDETIGGDIGKLLSRPMSEVVPAVRALEEHYKAIQRVVELTGDKSLLKRADAAIAALNDAAVEAAGLTGAAKMGAASKALVGAAVGTGALDAAGYDIPGPLDELLQAAAMGRLAGGAGAAVAKRAGGKVAAMRAMFQGAGRRVAPQFVRGSAGAPGSFSATAAAGAAAVAGGRAFGGLFDTIVGQRAIAGAGAGAKGRIRSAVENKKLGSHLRKAAMRSSITSMSLLRGSTFSYDSEAIAKRPVPKTNQEAHALLRTELARVAANPDAAQKVIHDELEPLRRIHPGVADETEMIAIGTPLYLYEKFTKDPGVHNRFGVSTWKPSEYDILRDAEYLRGALTPVEVFEDVMEGKAVSPQAMDALRNCHPGMFKEMQAAVLENSAELAKTCDLQDRTRISLLVDAPVDSTMRPEFRQFMKERNQLRAQAAAQAPKQGPAMGGSSSGSASAGTPLTSAQQLLK